MTLNAYLVRAAWLGLVSLSTERASAQGDRPTPPAPAGTTGVVRAAAARSAPSTAEEPPAAPAGQGAPPSPEATPERGAVAAPAAADAPPEPAPEFGGATFFDSPAGGHSQGASLKLYGDTELQAHHDDRWRANFATSHFELFTSADVGRLSFLSELMFEGQGHEIAVDLDRTQLTYLFANWLRVRAGRMHNAFGYYGDTYNHGNVYELTTSRPASIDEGGLLVPHVIGVAVDGTFDAGDIGSFSYDVQVADGRSLTPPPSTSPYVPDYKLVNVRLRWLEPSGFIIGINALRDAAPSSDLADPPQTHVLELCAGAHLDYLEHSYHVLVEAFAIRHESPRLATTTTYGGFAELGYQLGAFTPYVRPEWIRFPKTGDVLYQAAGSPYAGLRDHLDFRFGLRWQPLVELALKVEGQRLSQDGAHQELATVKAAFGF